MRSTPAVGCAAALLLSCSRDAGTPPAPVPAPAVYVNPIDARLLQIAAEYESYGRADQTSSADVVRCELSTPADFRTGGRNNRAADTATHRTLFRAFARDREAYIASARRASPVGQAVVKETWDAEPASSGAAPAAASGPPVAHKNGRTYRAFRKGDLYIMYKLEPSTPDTDEGWVYGIVTDGGRAVTDAGPIRHCIACHRSAPNDRMFGPPKD